MSEGFNAIFEEWESFWHKQVGHVEDDSSTTDRMTCRFDSAITRVRFRGLAPVPVLILAELSPEVREAIRPFVAETPSGSLGIIVCLKQSTFDHVRDSPKLPPDRFLLLSPENAKALRCAQRPLDILRREFLRQVPFHRLIPYTISEPTEGGMFVGRAHELRTLMYEDQDFVLHGPGGVGKTSLLRQMQWELRRKRDPRAKRLIEIIWCNCPVDLDAAANVVAKAVIPSLRAQVVTCSNLAAFLRRIRLSDTRFDDGPIDLIIDETDELLALDRRTVSGGHNYPLMRQLRTARLQGSIRLTLSGREETLRLLNESGNPFALGNPQSHGQEIRTRFKELAIGPLTPEEARDLLVGPLTDLEFPLHDNLDQVEQRLQTAAGIPAIIQSAGLDLANSVARGMTHLFTAS